MKTKEFIEAVKQRGYKAIESDFFYDVHNPDEERIGSVAKNMPYVCSTVSQELNSQIDKLILEYAMTPNEEREGKKKYKVTAHLDFTEDVLELDDNLTEEEVKKELYEYACSFLYWSYKKVEEN
ncbi:hypothetical protein HKO22_03210 [Peptoniphilus sp. AGMB00490]|uniref:Uncharacterized protein n=1 Tax=Peptoniphilus faecalis TaxID=2731255 RepID=A0A848RH50_9FIRM|nr:hypothetical protein [Peptoniphilus faecalis]NMW84753.1 hypothetical protein [Peptoniphilus faecalis]